MTIRELYSGTGMLHLGNVHRVKSECWTTLITIWTILSLIIILHFTLTKSMRNEILRPMEHIVRIIDGLIEGSDEPMQDTFRRNVSFLQKMRLRLFKNHVHTTAETKKHEEVYEIEKAVLRVGNLLRLGLGEAGAKIITSNMKDGEMVYERGGRLVHAIFGFCDIRNFTDCTEVLRANIVNLVNGVAKHVHTCVLDNYGAPNKNIGDAFLLVWKPKGEVGISTVADSSLRSYVRAIIQMQMCKELHRWEAKSSLQTRMPGFRVQLGYGLHYGWVSSRNPNLILSNLI